MSEIFKYFDQIIINYLITLSQVESY